MQTIYNQYAAHYIFIPDVGYISHCMICTDSEGVVIAVKPFYLETENTIWCQGVIILHCEEHFDIKELMLISNKNKLQFSDVCEHIGFVEDKGYHATLLSSFNFSTMTPYDETLHTLLQ